VLGLLPPVVMHLLWRVTGQRSFRRILFAWELAAPIVMLAATLMIVLPPRLLKLVTNYTEEFVPLGDGATLTPGAESRAMWAWHVLSPPPPPLCTCGDSHCDCSTPAPVHGVGQVAFGCFGGTCKKDTKYVKYAGTIIPVTNTRGIAGSPLRFRANAASPGMTLAASGFSAEARNVPRVNDATLPLPMLPPRTPYDLTFTDGKEKLGTLSGAGNTVIRIDLDPASHDEPQEDFQIVATVGKIRSTWVGPLDQIRACADPASVDKPNAPSVELRSKQGVACRLSSGERVVALDAALLAPGQALPPAEARLVHACLGTAGSLEIVGISQGRQAKLPADLAFADLRVRRPERDDVVVVQSCSPGNTLRAVTLEVKDEPYFKIDPVRIERLDATTGVTCDPPQPVSDDKRTCELTRTALTCKATAPPQPPLKVVDCSIDNNNNPHWSRTCHPCLRGVVTDELRSEAEKNGLVCRSVCRCE
jgi:hypothetical protein